MKLDESKMNRNDNNFRRAYLASLGLSSHNEVTQYVEDCLQHYPIQQMKLRKLAQKGEIPSKLRGAVWQILLGKCH